MKYDDLNLKRIREVPIFDVCSKLGISLYGMGKLTKRAMCWYHDDKHPSMHVNKKKNIFKCFVCGKGGDVIRLVQDYDNKSFIEACDWIIKEFDIVLISNTKSVSTNTNLTNQTNKKFSHFSILDAAKTDSLDSNNSCSEKTISVNSVVSVCPLDPSLVSRSLSVDSQFCKSLVSTGYLTEAQLRHAVSRYRLGRTKDGGVIFWQIDDQQRVHTGKIMYYLSDCHRDKERHPTWVHSLMKDSLPPNFDFQPCLFGLHLVSNTIATPHSVPWSENRTNLTNNKFSHSPILDSEKKDSLDSYNSCSGNPSVVVKVAIVESEKTAVILSEKFPDFLWLSCGGLQSFKPQLLEPLLQYRIIIFPDTDPQGEAFRLWCQVASDAQRLYHFRYPLRVSSLLELHTTLEQKQRKIDLVDLLFEVCDSARTVSCSHEHCRAQADSTGGQHEFA